VSRVPPKFNRAGGTSQSPKVKQTKSRRVHGKTSNDGFFDEEQLTDEDGLEDAQRQAQASEFLDREGDERGRQQDPKAQKKEPRKDPRLEAKQESETEKGGKAEKSEAAKTAKPTTDGQQELEKLKAKVEKLEKTSSINPPALKVAPGDAMAFLHAAKPPGEFFKELETEADGQGPGTEAHAGIDPELLAAVAEARVLLQDVPGIRRISPGTDDENNPVIVVSVERGFTQASLRLVPEKVRGFQTLLAIPYDLLPLKRERPLGT
jgi:hypothetical protein